jgi:hypothetical protein
MHLPSVMQLWTTSSGCHLSVVNQLLENGKMNQQRLDFRMGSGRVFIVSRGKAVRNSEFKSVHHDSFLQYLVPTQAEIFQSLEIAEKTQAETAERSTSSGTMPHAQVVHSGMKIQIKQYVSSVNV